MGKQPQHSSALFKGIMLLLVIGESAKHKLYSAEIHGSISISTTLLRFRRFGATRPGCHETFRIKHPDLRMLLHLTIIIPSPDPRHVLAWYNHHSCYKSLLRIIGTPTCMSNDGTSEHLYIQPQSELYVRSALSVLRFFFCGGPFASGILRDFFKTRSASFVSPSGKTEISK